MVPRRPDHDRYFIGIAFAVRERAECLGRKVGAVLVRDGRIIATGYNGTPDHMPNCDEHERGCRRCSQPELFEPGAGYDLCICVHAEQNALLSAARFGIAVEGQPFTQPYDPALAAPRRHCRAKSSRC